jgi:hypothetical protein
LIKNYLDLNNFTPFDPGLRIFVDWAIKSKQISDAEKIF